MDLSLSYELAEGYRSERQIARVVTQNWVRRNVPCLSCWNEQLEPTRENTKARDFNCPNCSEPFELKARRDSIGHVVPDGAYSSLYEAIVTGMAPNLLLLAYGSQTRRVIDLFAVHRSLLTPLALFKRKELPPTARRAGWVGCNLLLDSLPDGAVIPVVQRGLQIERQVISAAWDRYRFLDHSAISDEGWTADVLSCLKKLPNRMFTLADAYRFEGDLQPLHPSNRNVRPKIRQQLQVLVAHGLLDRISTGVYRLSG